jgi:molybdenum cofactor cytidylyltransferase
MDVDAQAGQPGGVCALVLAAGRGSRFGGDKLLALHRGHPVLHHVMAAAAAASNAGWLTRIIGVVPAGQAVLSGIVTEAGGHPVIQPDPDAEMASSLRLGLDAAAGADAALILLGDQPLVTPETIGLLVAAHRDTPNAVIRPRYEADPDQPGHPVIVPARWWPLLRGDEGEKGFGQLLTTEAVPSIDLPVPGHNPDIDTPADLKRLAAVEPRES